MKHVKKSLILFAALILQNVFGGHIAVLGIKPSLFLVITVIFSLNSDDVWEALIYGVATGFVYDVFWGRVFGGMTVLMMYIAVAIYYAGEYLYKKTVTEAAAITFIGTLIIEALFYGVNFALFGDKSFLYALLRIIIPTAAYNSIVTALIYQRLSKVFDKKRGEGA